MEHTPRSDNETPAEAGQVLETAERWDLTNEAFIDEFEEHEGLYRVTYDSVQATPSVVVITVVSNITGIDPLDLDPIYQSIDADAMDAMFTADISSVTRLTFQYSGFEITVGTDDVVEMVAK